MAKIAYEAERKDLVNWYALNNITNNSKKKKVEEYGEEGQKHFIATLHFNGLNNITYSDIKNDVHNQWLVQGRDTMPTRINHMIRLCKQ